MKKKIIISSVFLILIAVIVLIIYLFNLYDTNLVNPNDIVTDPEFEDVTYDKVEEIGEDVIGILTIDKIKLKATIKEGSDNVVLRDYIGHIENTAIFDGNVGLAAHNRGNQYSYFARINELKKGDNITYQTKFFTRNYMVANIKTILETDWSPLKDTQENKLTLITCIANKRVQRLCIQATEIIE